MKFNRHQPDSPSEVEESENSDEEVGNEDEGEQVALEGDQHRIDTTVGVDVETIDDFVDDGTDNTVEAEVEHTAPEQEENGTPDASTIAYQNEDQVNDTYSGGPTAYYEGSVGEDDFTPPSSKPVTGDDEFTPEYEEGKREAQRFGRERIEDNYLTE